MASIAWSDVVDIASELSATDPEAQTIYLATANAFFNVLMFGGEDGPNLKQARIYLAAHMATLDRMRGIGIAGPVISESRQGLSRSYANLTTTGTGVGTWGQTTYGQLLGMLVRTSPRARFPTVA